MVIQGAAYMRPSALSTTSMTLVVQIAMALFMQRRIAGCGDAYLGWQHDKKPVVYIIEHGPGAIKHGVELEECWGERCKAQPSCTRQLEQPLQA